jgi:hypothetical protein
MGNGDGIGIHVISDLAREAKRGRFSDVGKLNLEKLIEVLNRYDKHPDGKVSMRCLQPYFLALY